MDPLTIAAIGAALGLVKSQTLDKDKERRQREYAAKTQALSPWTHLQAPGIQESDPLGSMMSTGLMGYQIGTGMEDASTNKKLVDSIIAKNAADSVKEIKPPTELGDVVKEVPSASSFNYDTTLKYKPQRSNYSYVPFWQQGNF